MIFKRQIVRYIPPSRFSGELPAELIGDIDELLKAFGVKLTDKNRFLFSKLNPAYRRQMKSRHCLYRLEIEDVVDLSARSDVFQSAASRPLLVLNFGRYIPYLAIGFETYTGDAESVERALACVPLTTMSTYGGGGWLPVEHVGGDALALYVRLVEIARSGGQLNREQQISGSAFGALMNCAVDRSKKGICLWSEVKIRPWTSRLRLVAKLREQLPEVQAWDAL